MVQDGPKHKQHKQDGRRISPRHMFDPGGTPGLVMGQCIVEIYRIVTRDVQYQLEVNRCRNEEVNLQGSSAYSVGGDTEITTISPRFSIYEQVIRFLSIIDMFGIK
ncbi:hypothetical protein DPMN_057862 [Dreissena polymorpha]|uniref:Uncharacterized protein n=1 Tax=Dreissena polymorpha TaxID=45954 RepID=A0A9D4C0Y5_DREPO|nr:hypothetical protein DPMN_057862 [Dreissena polymorpha]